MAPPPSRSAFDAPNDPTPAATCSAEARGPTRPPRILYVIGSLELGGAERHLAAVACGLKSQAHFPEFFVLTPGGPLTGMLESAGIPIHGFSAPGWLRKLVPHKRAYAWIVLLISATTLLRTLWWRRPDVVHFFLPAAYVVGGVVSLFAPLPVRIMSRRSLNHYQQKHRLFARIERFLHGRMTAVCANSRAVASELVEEGVDPKRLRLIYNGVASVPDATSASPATEDGPLVFAIVANLIPYKGHADLLDAFGMISAQLPENWSLWCIGRDDGIGAALRSQAERLGISDHVRLLGSRRDVADLLRQANIGVLSSHEEGFSNAVLECMAAGLPLVVTDVGGNAEAVVNGECGYVVPARNPNALADALIRIAKDPHRAEMGAAGRRRAQDVFSMAACLNGYRQLYAECTPSRRGCAD